MKKTAGILAFALVINLLAFGSRADKNIDEYVNSSDVEIIYNVENDTEVFEEESLQNDETPEKEEIEEETSEKPKEEVSEEIKEETFEEPKEEVSEEEIEQKIEDLGLTQDDLERMEDMGLTIEDIEMASYEVAPIATISRPSTPTTANPHTGARALTTSDLPTYSETYNYICTCGVYVDAVAPASQSTSSTYGWHKCTYPVGSTINIWGIVGALGSGVSGNTTGIWGVHVDNSSIYRYIPGPTLIAHSTGSGNTVATAWQGIWVYTPYQVQATPVATPSVTIRDQTFLYYDEDGQIVAGNKASSWIQAYRAEYGITLNVTTNSTTTTNEYASWISTTNQVGAWGGPSDPEVSGWSFLGWYTDASFTTPYVHQTAVTAPITLYAKMAEGVQVFVYDDTKTFIDNVFLPIGSTIKEVDIYGNATGNEIIVTAEYAASNPISDLDLSSQTYLQDNQKVGWEIYEATSGNYEVKPYLISLVDIYNNENKYITTVEVRVGNDIIQNTDKGVLVNETLVDTTIKSLTMQPVAKEDYQSVYFSLEYIDGDAVLTPYFKNVVEIYNNDGFKIGEIDATVGTLMYQRHHESSAIRKTESVIGDYVRFDCLEVVTGTGEMITGWDIVQDDFGNTYITPIVAVLSDLPIYLPNGTLYDEYSIAWGKEVIQQKFDGTSYKLVTMGEYVTRFDMNSPEIIEDWEFVSWTVIQLTSYGTIIISPNYEYTGKPTTTVVDIVRNGITIDTFSISVGNDINQIYGLDIVKTNAVTSGYTTFEILEVEAEAGYIITGYNCVQTSTYGSVLITPIIETDPDYNPARPIEIKHNGVLIETVYINVGNDMIQFDGETIDRTMTVDTTTTEFNLVEAKEIDGLNFSGFEVLQSEKYGTVLVTPIYESESGETEVTLEIIENGTTIATVIVDIGKTIAQFEDGETTKIQITVDNSDFVTIEVQEKEGYEFVKFEVLQAGDGDSVVVNAIYEKIIKTQTINLIYDEKIFETVTVLEGETITQLQDNDIVKVIQVNESTYQFIASDPTEKVGYVFAGFNVAQSGENGSVMITPTYETDIEYDPQSHIEIKYNGEVIAEVSVEIGNDITQYLGTNSTKIEKVDKTTLEFIVQEPLEIDGLTFETFEVLQAEVGESVLITPIYTSNSSTKTKDIMIIADGKILGTYTVSVGKTIAQFENGEATQVQVTMADTFKFETIEVKQIAGAVFTGFEVLQAESGDSVIVNAIYETDLSIQEVNIIENGEIIETVYVTIGETISQLNNLSFAKTETVMSTTTEFITISAPEKEGMIFDGFTVLQQNTNGSVLIIPDYIYDEDYVASTDILIIFEDEVVASVAVAVGNEITQYDGETIAKSEKVDEEIHFFYLEAPNEIDGLTFVRFEVLQAEENGSVLITPVYESESGQESSDITIKNSNGDVLTVVTVAIGKTIAQFENGETTKVQITEDDTAEFITLDPVEIDGMIFVGFEILQVDENSSVVINAIYEVNDVDNTIKSIEIYDNQDLIETVYVKIGFNISQYDGNSVTNIITVDETTSRYDLVDVLEIEGLIFEGYEVIQTSENGSVLITPIYSSKNDVENTQIEIKKGEEIIATVTVDIGKTIAQFENGVATKVQTTEDDTEEFLTINVKTVVGYTFLGFEILQSTDGESVVVNAIYESIVEETQTKDVKIIQDGVVIDTVTILVNNEISQFDGEKITKTQVVISTTSSFTTTEPKEIAGMEFDYFEIIQATENGSVLISPVYKVLDPDVPETNNITIMKGENLLEIVEVEVGKTISQREVDSFTKTEIVNENTSKFTTIDVTERVGYEFISFEIIQIDAKGSVIVNAVYEKIANTDDIGEIREVKIMQNNVEIGSVYIEVSRNISQLNNLSFAKVETVTSETSVFNTIDVEDSEGYIFKEFIILQPGLYGDVIVNAVYEKSSTGNDEEVKTTDIQIKQDGTIIETVTVEVGKTIIQREDGVNTYTLEVLETTTEFNTIEVKEKTGYTFKEFEVIQLDINSSVIVNAVYEKIENTDDIGEIREVKIMQNNVEIGSVYIEVSRNISQLNNLSFAKVETVTSETSVFNTIDVEDSEGYTFKEFIILQPGLYGDVIVNAVYEKSNTGNDESTTIKSIDIIYNNETIETVFVEINKEITQFNGENIAKNSIVDINMTEFIVLDPIEISGLEFVSYEIIQTEENGSVIISPVYKSDDATDDEIITKTIEIKQNGTVIDTVTVEVGRTIAQVEDSNTTKIETVLNSSTEFNTIEVVEKTGYTFKEFEVIQPDENGSVVIKAVYELDNSSDEDDDLENNESEIRTIDIIQNNTIIGTVDVEIGNTISQFDGETIVKTVIVNDITTLFATVDVKEIEGLVFNSFEIIQSQENGSVLISPVYKSVNAENGEILTETIDIIVANPISEISSISLENGEVIKTITVEVGKTVAQIENGAITKIETVVEGMTEFITQEVIDREGFIFKGFEVIQLDNGGSAIVNALYENDESGSNNGDEDNENATLRSVKIKQDGTTIATVYVTVGNYISQFDGETIVKNEVVTSTTTTFNTITPKEIDGLIFERFEVIQASENGAVMVVPVYKSENALGDEIITKTLDIIQNNKVIGTVTVEVGKSVSQFENSKATKTEIVTENTEEFETITVSARSGYTFSKFEIIQSDENGSVIVKAIYTKNSTGSSGGSSGTTSTPNDDDDITTHDEDDDDDVITHDDEDDDDDIITHDDDDDDDDIITHDDEDDDDDVITHDDEDDDDDVTTHDENDDDRTYIYDKNGNITGYIDQNGNIFDVDGNYLGYIDSDGNIYDKNGNLIGGLDEDGNIYNAQGGLVSTTNVPQTSDNTHIFMLAILFIMSSVAVVFTSKKRKTKH